MNDRPEDLDTRAVLAERPDRRIPDDLRPHLLADADYVDCFRHATDAASTWSPEQWARVTLDQLAGAKGQFIWRVVLALRLAPRTRPGHVAGWRIAEHGPTWIRLEATGPLISGEIVIHLDDTYASMITSVRFHNRFAALQWRTLSGIHRKAVPELLRDADRLRRS